MDVRLREQLAGFHYVLLGSKKGQISRGQIKIWQNRSTLPFCYSVKDQCIFVDLLQIKDKFHCQESIIIHGVSAYERA